MRGTIDDYLDIEEVLYARCNESPCTHVSGLLLRPHEVFDMLEGAQCFREIGDRERAQLFEPDDSDVIAIQLLSFGLQGKVVLARYQNDLSN